MAGFILGCSTQSTSAAKNDEVRIKTGQRNVAGLLTMMDGEGQQVDGGGYSKMFNASDKWRGGQREDGNRRVKHGGAACIHGRRR